jgi:hypothetical protein
MVKDVGFCLVIVKPIPMKRLKRPWINIIDLTVINYGKTEKI